MRKVLQVMSVVGFVLPYAIIAPWVACNGLDLESLFGLAAASPVWVLVALDVLLSAFAIVALCIERVRLGDTRMVWPIIGTLAVGVSLSLPLYLYLKTADAADQVTGHE